MFQTLFNSTGFAHFNTFFATGSNVVLRKCLKILIFSIDNNRALDERDAHLAVSHEWSNFCDELDAKKIIQAPFCGEVVCEDKIKKDSAR